MQILKTESKSPIDLAIDEIKHYLPSQAPLKDFIHHNTLHAFQNYEFHQGIQLSQKVFGFKTYLEICEYQKLFHENKISKEIIFNEIKIKDLDLSFFDFMIDPGLKFDIQPKVGRIRQMWEKIYNIDMDIQTYPLLFKYICNYLDQGISQMGFPYPELNFFEALKSIDRSSKKTVLFSDKGRARKLLHSESTSISDLLKILIKNESFHKNYLFDQQMSHPGWSGLVAQIESDPNSLILKRFINLKDIIKLELLLEIDFLDHFVGEKNWQPLDSIDPNLAEDLFALSAPTKAEIALEVFQKSYEKTYYDQVLTSLNVNLKSKNKSDLVNQSKVQALFCIDDRECSLRRYLESSEMQVETYGTPGFFGFEFYFQPGNSKNITKLCPAPVTPKFLIKEIGTSSSPLKDMHLKSEMSSILQSWVQTHILGYISAFKLLLNLFRPEITPGSAIARNHMDQISNLTLVHDQHPFFENGLQVGFTVEQMADRVSSVLKSIGLVENFSELIYIVAHGASSVNNPHYSAYDCGACCGRPGSVNSRVFAAAANTESVRQILKDRGLNIPGSSYFIGCLHDTTRDEVEFFDENMIPEKNLETHEAFKSNLIQSLAMNSKERSRRFYNLDPNESSEALNYKIKKRSVSLFEPRPELNHATNTLCLVGPRHLSKDIFLDRRSFLNSYNPEIDSEGNLLEGILNAAAPVCGGINLEYYFSRVDNNKLGAGTKLPHNIMGLVGVANGLEGDLRPGLPSQMIEVHDPLRLLIVVYQKPDFILDVIKRKDATFEWFKNEWVNLVAIDPKSHIFYIFEKGNFKEYEFTSGYIVPENSLENLILSTRENIKPNLIKDAK